MLLLGHPSCIPDIKDLIVYNLSSLLEGYQRVDILPPVNNVDYMNELDFDIAYANYIMGNNNIFYEFFSKIIYPLYNGYNVYLMTTRNIFYDKVSDSLMKFIQQRYEYLSAIINEPDDIDYINPDIGFGINGVYNLDMDKERFSQMYVCQNMDSTTGRINGFE
jgi:hypothetical protein